jgi:hypothetical protein
MNCPPHRQVTKSGWNISLQKGSAVARERSSRARQTAVVVLDVMLYCGPAITPDKKVAFLLGYCSAYDGWLITPPYIARLTMVSTKSWF